MLEDKRESAIRLKSTARRRANFVCVAFLVVFISFGVQASIALADTSGGLGVSDATSRKTSLIKKSDAACDATSASKNAHGCLVSLSAIDKLRVQKGFTFVDVRSPAEFDRFRIAGSINIPLHLVKTKDFLKNMPVVLLNDGRSTVELEKTCAELKQSGFEHVNVLDGGLFAWYVSKRPLEGDPIEQAKLNRMSAEELFEVHSLANWAAIDVSTPGKNKDISSWLPKTTIASPIKAKGDSIAKISSAISLQRKKNPQSKLLLIADSDDVYDRIDARLRKSGVTSGVLRLDGGIKVYREHVKKQLAIWSHQNELLRPRRYAACPG